MLSYCLKCRKNAKTKNPKVVKTKNGRIMHLSGNKDIFNEIPLLGPLLF